MKSFALNSKISATHIAIISPAADGSATVTIRDGYQSRDTTNVKICATIDAAKIWARTVLTCGAYTSEGSL